MAQEISTKKTVLLLILVVLTGFFLRVAYLDAQNFWNDEAFSVHHAEQPSLQQTQSLISLSEAAPIGYYALLHYWIYLFGNSEFAVRFLSVLFATLSIPLLYLTTRTYLSRNISLLTSFFMAISISQILYAQEARLYSLFTFLSLLATYFFILLYKTILNPIHSQNSTQKRKIILSLIYIIIITLSLYVNYLAVFLIAFYTLILFWKWDTTKTFLAMWIWLHVAVVILCIPLYNILLIQFTSINQGLAKTLAAKGLPLLLAKLGLLFFALPFVIIFTLLTLAFIFSKKTKYSSLTQKFNLSDFTFLTLLILFSAIYLYLTKNTLSLFGIPLFLSPITESYFLIRHSLFLAPILFVYLAYRTLHIKKQNIQRLALLLIVLTSLFAITQYYHTNSNAPWQEATLFIAENSHLSSQPLILLDKAGFSNLYLLNYYSQEYNFNIQKIAWSDRQEAGRQFLYLTDQELQQLVKDHSEFWLVLATPSERATQTLTQLTQSSDLVLQQHYSELDLYKFKN